MTNELKLLIVGDVDGQFTYLLEKLRSISQKTPFNIVFCVGEFFGDNGIDLSEYQNGSKTIPVPIYITGTMIKDRSRFYDGFDSSGTICKNLYYLGKKGLNTFPDSGLKVAFLSGLDKETVSDDLSETFNKNDVLSICQTIFRDIRQSYRGIDILLTSQWPYGLGTSTDTEQGSKLISYLVKEIRPRYHFSSFSQTYMELPPFRIPASNVTNLQLMTRFISLGKCAKKSRQKYMYGLNITPVNRMRVLDLIQRNVNETECPLVACELDNGQSKENSQYFYDLRPENSNENQQPSTSKNKRSFNREDYARKKLKPINLDSCWFCVSSPNVEKDYIVYVGKTFYIALDKGPINKTHLLLIPIRHVQKSSQLNNDEWNELMDLKCQLNIFFSNENKRTLLWQRSFSCFHLIIEVIALDVGISLGRLLRGFQEMLTIRKAQYNESSPLQNPSDFPESDSYFIVEFPDDRIFIIKNVGNIPKNFGRMVICSPHILNCEEKIDWTECVIQKEEKKEIVEKFRKAFECFKKGNSSTK